MAGETTNQEALEQEGGPVFADLLKVIPGAPKPEDIEAWKVKFGDVFVSGFSPTELYIWRPIRRGEWRSLQARMADPEQKVDQLRWEEMVCEQCVLWPTTNTDFWSDPSKAGTPSSLSEQILQNSNFLSPQQAAMLVQKL